MGARGRAKRDEELVELLVEICLMLPKNLVSVVGVGVC